MVKDGTAVIFTAEDDEREIHRRRAAIGELAPEHESRLVIVPLPDAGGPLPLFRDTRKGFETTPGWDALTTELVGIRDLRLVVFDPLQAFVAAGINEDPAAGQFVCSCLGHLAATTGATVVVSHHMRKSSKPITTLAEAREAIRGTTALVDGLRWVFALWPTEETTTKTICRELGRAFAPNAIVQGGVVKANGAARREVRTYSRRPDGLLRDVTLSAGRATETVQFLDAIVYQISRAATAGSPFTHTGEAGVFRQRQRLPASLRDLSRHRLEGLVQHALEDGRVVKCIGPGSTVARFLDVPGGPFARGEAEVARGAAA